MCRGIIKTGTAKVPQMGNPECQKPGLCPEQASMSFIQSLLMENDPQYPVYCIPDKQPLKRPPVYNTTEQAVQSAAPQPTKRPKFSPTPKLLKAEPEYVVPDTDATPIISVDTLTDGCVSSRPVSIETSTSVPLTETREPWETFLDELQEELNSSPAPSPPTYSERKDESGTGGSLIAQLLLTEKPVREVYKKLKEETVEQPTPVVSPPYGYDSGYDDSPPPPFEMVGSPDEFTFNFDSFSLQPSPQQSLQPKQGSVFSPPSSQGQKVPSFSSSMPPSASPRCGEDNFSLSPAFKQDWLYSPPADCDTGLATEQIFEPKGQQWEQQVFTSPQIFPLSSPNQLALESDLILAEAYFNPGLELGNVVF